MREPIFKAPWPATTAALAIVGAYAVQTTLSQAWVYDRLGFTSAALAAGEYSGLVTALFVHASWAHALMNAVAALAFGAPVARLFGGRAGGVLAFFVFYLACGVLASLGYAAVHPHDPAVLVGASGAVSGLMGAASRLIAGRGGLGPMLSRPVVAMAGAWVIVNLLLAATGMTPGAEGGTVAWEAHLFGYAAGLLLIGPVAWLTRRARPPEVFDAVD